jgi:UDP:flavonoid glycosyltransferase YjiC (YdhE family)
VLESLTARWPLLVWPMMAEQAVNAKHVADILGVE